MATFAAAFVAAGLALAKVALVIVAAGVLVRRGVLTQTMVDALSTATVVLFLPCLMFANITEHLDPHTLPWWWVLPLVGIAMSLVGLALAAALFAGSLREKRHLLPVAAMQNAGYLVLPVGLVLFPEQFDTFALYCFLFILGFSPWLWSVGKHLVTGGGDGRGWRGLITPPLVATVTAVAAVLTGLDALIPRVAADAVAMIGQAAVPVATVVLGASLGGVRPELAGRGWDAARLLLVKLMLLPAVTVALLLAFDVAAIDPMLARFLVIQAAVAPAANLILMVRTYGGHERELSSHMLLAYIVCGVTLPAWLALWELLAR